MPILKQLEVHVHIASVTNIHNNHDDLDSMWVTFVSMTHPYVHTVRIDTGNLVYADSYMYIL